MKTPQQLYEDWERAHWAAQDIDLGHSTQFCGLVLAQDDEEEGSFLSTQLVDENRHMQFYARFQNEVVAHPAAIGAYGLNALTRRLNVIGVSLG
jgi:hypothetical protein